MTRRQGRKPTNTIWLFCEGEKTERVYFQKLKRDLRINRFKIEILTTRGKDALSLVRDAVSFKSHQARRFQEDDLIYCIFDRNANSNQRLTQAINLAHQHDIEIIFSNPCFEYWFLCHFEYYITNCSCIDLEGKLAQHMGSYDKRDENNYYRLRSRKRHAIINSKRGFRHHTSNGTAMISRQSNPSTTVYMLIEKLDNL